VRVRVNVDRARRVADAIRGYGLEGILRLEERDPQYVVARRVSRVMGPGRAASLLALVALASYRLAMKGEEYWGCLADLVERERPLDVLGAAVLFLRSCRGAVVRREAKISRVQRAYSGARDLFARLEDSPDSLSMLVEPLLERLSRVLRADRRSKTLVFAVKMAYYAVRPPGLRYAYNIRIPVPVDVRVSCLTYTSGVVEADGYRTIFSHPQAARDAWSLVSSLSGVPELHLDALLWTSGRVVMERDDPVPWLARHLDPGGPSGGAVRLARELAWRRCV